MIKTVREKLEKIRDLAKVGREHSLPAGYTGDVKNFLRQIQFLAEDLLKKWKS